MSLPTRRAEKRNTVLTIFEFQTTRFFYGGCDATAKEITTDQDITNRITDSLAGFHFEVICEVFMFCR